MTGKLWREFYDYAIAHGATMSQALHAANEAIQAELTPCPHGLPVVCRCELCRNEQETADDQATDDDWRDWS